MPKPKPNAADKAAREKWKRKRAASRVANEDRREEREIRRWALRALVALLAIADVIALYAWSRWR